MKRAKHKMKNGKMMSGKEMKSMMSGKQIKKKKKRGYDFKAAEKKLGVVY